MINYKVGPLVSSIIIDISMHVHFIKSIYIH